MKLYVETKKIRVNESVKQYYKLISSDSIMIFYKTLFDNVHFIDELNNSKRKCIQFGKTEFNFGKI